MSNVNWESRRRYTSVRRPDVTYIFRRMSFGRRIDLMRRVRELAVRLEYFEAGRDEKNLMEASLVGAEIDGIYLEWGLEGIDGLFIDGQAATCEAFIEAGPEDLVLEALEQIRSDCGLDEQERKN